MERHTTIYGRTQSHEVLPPALKTVLEKLPAHHPRVWLDKDEWDSFIENSQGKPERRTYLKRANKVLATPMKSVNDINSDLAKGLTNKVQQSAMLTRESRRIIDSEEANTDVLIRAYLLTKDRRYADEAVKRVKEMATWGDNKNVVGDFNEATLLSLCSMAYDALYDVLDNATRKFLLNEIKEFGSSMYKHDINRLENHIADNHVWQMTFRILTMAAFTVYGELPEADAWTDYCYNLWLARFPGLNKDGGWHNGDPTSTSTSAHLWKFPISIRASPDTTTSPTPGIRETRCMSSTSNRLSPNRAVTAARIRMYLLPTAHA